MRGRKGEGSVERFVSCSEGGWEVTCRRQGWMNRRNGIMRMEMEKLRVGWLRIYGDGDVRTQVQLRAKNEWPYGYLFISRKQQGKCTMIG